MTPQPASNSCGAPAPAPSSSISAPRIGDILTVRIDIDDSARTQNNTTTSRTTSRTMGFPHLFGLESSLGKILPGGFDPPRRRSRQARPAPRPAPAVTRSEISLTVAAVVTGVLPSSNLVIQAPEEVMTNGEVRRLTVSGIVRPEDISAANTIKHTQIAEARIAYGGRDGISPPAADSGRSGRGRAVHAVLTRRGSLKSSELHGIRRVPSLRRSIPMTRLPALIPRRRLRRPRRLRGQPRRARLRLELPEQCR